MDHTGIVEEFVDRDEDYRRWVAEHPAGFVLNTPRRPTASYLFLHRASCRSVTGTPANGGAWTHDYIKVCAEGAEDLEEWALVATGGQVHKCRLCHNERPAN